LVSVAGQANVIAGFGLALFAGCRSRATATCPARPHRRLPDSRLPAERCGPRQ
jgi:hypothetical protein